MKVLIFIIILTTSSFSIFSAGETNHLILIGGGGEPAEVSGPTKISSLSNSETYIPSTESDPFHQGTIFDTALKSIDQFVRDSSYQSSISFNGGHSRTEAILNERFSKNPSPKSPFTEQSYRAIIEDYTLKLQAQIEYKKAKEKNPNLPSPPALEKILIYIDSHGAEVSEDRIGKEAHHIATSNSSKVDLNELQKLTTLAELAGTKLAIVDMSCHSGNTLSLANPNTCVISASGPSHYAYGRFSNTFSSKMKSGKNLEEIFLETRNEVDGTGFPMISTPIGTAIQNKMYKLLTPYMFYHEKNLPYGSTDEKIDRYLKNSCQELICKRESDFKELEILIQNIEDLYTFEKGAWIFKTKIKEVDLSELRNQVTKYKEIQDEYLNALSSLGDSDLNLVEKFTGISVFSNSEKGKKPMTSEQEFSIKEILSTDFTKRIADEEIDMSKYKSIGNDNLAAHSMAKIDLYQKAQKRQNELKSNPIYKKRAEIIEKIKNDERLTEETAHKIAGEAQKAYSALYKAKQKENSPPNPCKDFVL